MLLLSDDSCYLEEHHRSESAIISANITFFRAVNGRFCTTAKWQTVKNPEFYLILHLLAKEAPKTQFLGETLILFYRFVFSF